jgi:hypothetical protein
MMIKPLNVTTSEPLNVAPLTQMNAITTHLNNTQSASISRAPLRGGFNSIVPNLEKWRQFDDEVNLKRQALTPAHREQLWREQMAKHWLQLLDKMHWRHLG